MNGGVICASSAKMHFLHNVEIIYIKLRLGYNYKAIFALVALVYNGNHNALPDPSHESRHTIISFGLHLVYFPNRIFFVPETKACEPTPTNCYYYYLF